ncbi:hypothetical protein CPB84DRAFT_1789699 [Gymnopilus junonius]|uniref:Uncharacterized protein n=1 Tax=Gymnopilus junonius TaxID=109634 RepID=A0A9P5NFZ7_GYMJU|nr:hypothetical protein CPB84DRAFT_1789699 [Gymnopilus junonius]
MLPTSAICYTLSGVCLSLAICLITFLLVKCTFKLWRLRVHIKVDSPVFIEPLVKITFPKSTDTGQKMKKVLISDAGSDIGFQLLQHYAKDPDAVVVACSAFQFGPGKECDLRYDLEIPYIEDRSRVPILELSESLEYDKPPQFVAATIDQLEKRHGHFTHFYDGSAMGEDTRYERACITYRHELATVLRNLPEYAERFKNLPEKRKQIAAGREAAIEEMMKLMKAQGKGKIYALTPKTELYLDLSLSGEKAVCRHDPNESFTNSFTFDPHSCSSSSSGTQCHSALSRFLSSLTWFCPLSTPKPHFSPITPEMREKFEEEERRLIDTMEESKFVQEWVEYIVGMVEQGDVPGPVVTGMFKQLHTWVLQTMLTLTWQGRREKITQKIT